MCVCVCMHVCMYLCMHVCECVYVSLCVPAYINMYGCSDYVCMSYKRGVQCHKKYVSSRYA